jgi:hypothetical protein
MIKTMKIIIFLFLFSFATISSVHAMSGEKWLSYCEYSGVKPYESGMCLGYIMGVSEHHVLIEQLLGIIENKLCIPSRATFKQLMEVAKKWLKEHPEKLHQDFSVSYLSIMKEVFPCKSQ